MNKKLYLPLLMAVVLAFTSCSKKIGEMNANFFNVSPQPLVAVGGIVPATIDGTFPEKFFTKKSVVTVTPVLVYEGGETKATSFVYQGEKVVGNDQTISYKMGGNISMKTAFEYIPEMRKSELYLDFSVVTGAKTYTLPRVKVADGVVATSTFATAEGADAAIAPDAFERITTEDFAAKILFLIQQANLRNSELTTEQMDNVKAVMKAAETAENQRISALNIASTASPDGTMELNTNLAMNREKNTTKYMERVLSRDNLTAEIFAEFTAEDWVGFQELVEKSNIQDKELILRVLSMYNSPEEREAELKNLAAAFTQLADDILPQLRYSKVTATIETIGKSDEEIAKLAKEDPKALNVEELLYAATLTNDNAAKLAIYEDATAIYPTDYRAYNNIGCIYFEEGDVAKAEDMFKRAHKVDPKSAEVAMNMGMVALSNRDFATAQQYFGQAAGVSELPAALGTLYTERGEYQKAVAAFGDTKSNNAAVAQICAGDYNTAKNTLSGVESKDALTYYLMAVVGARTNNENMVSSNLKEAVKHDASMAKVAMDDIEFSKYNVAEWVK